jgi:hypothetical protein
MREGGTNTHVVIEAAVFANNEWIELTKHIRKFSHYLSNTEASNASITLNSEHMNYKLDDFAFLKNGQKVVFHYGYRNAHTNSPPAMSRRYQAIIGDINYQYGSGGSEFILKLIDKGYFMKKVPSSYIWKNVTASEIAYRLAEVHGLTPVIDASSFKYQSLPQGLMNNYQFLKHLAKLEDGFVFFVRSNELHFKKVGTHSQPIFRLDIRGAIVTDFELVWQDIEDSKKISSLFSDDDGFSSRKALETATKIGEGLLNTFSGIVIDDNGKFFGGVLEPSKDKNADKKPITKTDPDKNVLDKVLDYVDLGINGVMDFGKKVTGQVENVAQKELGFLSESLKIKRKELTGNISLVGIPYFENDKTLIIENIHSRFTGVYYIEEVSHHIEESYTTDIRINKHGIRRVDDENPDKYSPTLPTRPTQNPAEEKGKQPTAMDALKYLVIGSDGELYGETQINDSIVPLTEEFKLPTKQK